MISSRTEKPSEWAKHVNTVFIILTHYVLGSLAERGGAELDQPDFSLGLSRMVSVEQPSPLPTPHHQGETHQSWESVEAGSHLMVSGWNLYRVVTGVEKLAMG